MDLQCVVCLIISELADLPFNELQKLKEQIGVKA
jgi:hypothetical protein